MTDYRDQLILSFLKDKGFSGDKKTNKAAFEIIGIFNGLIVICEKAKLYNVEIPFTKASDYQDGRWWVPVGTEDICKAYPEINKEIINTVFRFLCDQDIICSRTFETEGHKQIIKHSLNERIRIYM